MHKIIFSIAALIASIALLISSIGNSFAYPQGPNTDLGSNPVVTFVCNNGGYTVPSDQDLIVTDFMRTGNYPSIYINGSSAMYIGFDNLSLTTGWKVPAGSTVSCVSGTLYLSGYLTRA